MSNSTRHISVIILKYIESGLWEKSFKNPSLYDKASNSCLVAAKLYRSVALDCSK